jgi:hypothetical protein
MNPAWILMFYSMPSKPERNRLRMWRRLQKEGTLSLKDGVHLLPYSEDRYELFQWLSQEIKALGGEMQFVTIEKIEMMNNEEIITLFHLQSEGAYVNIEQKIKNITHELSSLDRPINSEQEHTYRQIIKKIINDFDPLFAIDFFHSEKGRVLKKAIQHVQVKLESFLESNEVAVQAIVPLLNIGHYHGKQWQTRTRPFVDRMASAWLIKKFIDTNAKFIFLNTIDKSNDDIVTYDMDQANFTHIGDLCTFEVLIKAFNIHDESVEAIGKIIHTLDCNDDKYITPEAEGIKLVLTGIRNNAGNDYEILIKSDEIFDYLYLTLQQSKDN